jgi:hypothetical protein
VCPGDTELLYLDAVLRRDQHDMAGAEASLLRLLHERPGEHFASVGPGMRGYKARHLLGVVYFEQGRLGEARTQWQAALAERGDFLPAWLGLGECGLRGWGVVDEIARALEGLPSGQADAGRRFGREYSRAEDRDHPDTRAFGPAGQTPSGQPDERNLPATFKQGPSLQRSAWRPFVSGPSGRHTQAYKM